MMLRGSLFWFGQWTSEEAAAATRFTDLLARYAILSEKSATHQTTATMRARHKTIGEMFATNKTLGEMMARHKTRSDINARFE